ncbi:unnamed protein product [Protopolystoma xenopodis]|uniref:Uncharacterized protein n=1 Tax=Protopolystoma xenopodis TaxID=117903 RepID=A0A3S5FGR2_9PLAT|nr:unnamed protein product [Protopolystoma xenopodis]
MGSLVSYSIIQTGIAITGTLNASSTDDRLCRPSFSSQLAVNSPQVASLALGHVAACLRLLAAVLDVPLRYPIDYRQGGSRVRISDLISPDLHEVERSFPLFLQRNVSLSDYRYAVHLLNLNVAVLCGACEVPIVHKRETLWNLKNLMDCKKLLFPIE